MSLMLRLRDAFRKVSLSSLLGKGCIQATIHPTQISSTHIQPTQIQTPIRSLTSSLTTTLTKPTLTQPKQIQTLIRSLTSSLTTTLSQPTLTQPTQIEPTLLQLMTLMKPMQIRSLTTTPHVSASLMQMHKSGPHRKKRSKRRPTDGRPFLRGVILKTLIKKPKKPNSANRKCVRVRLSNGKEATAYVPGEGHNLQEHNIVLVRGGRLQDVPGVHLKCVRGKYDLPHVKKPARL